MSSKIVKIGDVELSEKAPVHPAIAKILEANGFRAMTQRGAYANALAAHPDSGKPVGVRVEFVVKTEIVPEGVWIGRDSDNNKLDDEVTNRITCVVAARTSVKALLHEAGYVCPPPGAAPLEKETVPAPVVGGKDGEGAISKVVEQAPAPKPAPIVADAVRKHAQGIAARIRPVAEQKIGVSIELYGRSGTGKTTFASTAPKPELILDVREKGCIGLRAMQGIDVLDVQSWNDVVEVIKYLKENPGHYKSLVVDTVTGLQELATLKVLDDSKKKITDRLSLPEHGVVAQMVKDAIMDLRDLAPVVMYLAQDKKTGVDEEQARDQLMPEVGASVKESIAKTLNAAVSVIAQTYIKEEQVNDGKRFVMVPSYRLRIGPNSTFVTKIRCAPGQAVPQDIVNPSYEKLLAVVEGRSS